VPEPVAFEADHFERLFFGLSEFAGEPYEVQPEFGMAAPGRLNDLLTQQEREWEAGLAVEPEHAQAEEPGPAWAGSERGLSGDDEPGDGAEEHRPASRDRHTGYEVLAFVPELKTPSEVEWRSQWQEPIEPEAISTAAADGDAEDRDAETKTMEAAEPVRDEPVYSAAPVYREPAYSEPVPSEPVGEKFPIEYDADDIEPVLEEASRHLAPSRWDPIPTLRPDSNGWRDRPSPMPPTNPGAERRRWTGEDQDLEAWRSGPASGSGPRMDSLPEPLLTRQWGLLSKFQQSRLSSGSRPVAKTEEDEPVSNGNHKS
jgi:hypothetical protein